MTGVGGLGCSSSMTRSSSWHRFRTCFVSRPISSSVSRRVPRGHSPPLDQALRCRDLGLSDARHGWDPASRNRSEAPAGGHSHPPHGLRGLATHQASGSRARSPLSRETLEQLRAPDHHPEHTAQTGRRRSPIADIPRHTLSCCRTARHFFRDLQGQRGRTPQQERRDDDADGQVSQCVDPLALGTETVFGSRVDVGEAGDS